VDTCQLCRASGPVADVHYWQNTGLLIVRQQREVAGRLCRTCSLRSFRDLTLHTLFFGWWGMISFFVTPVFLVLNVWSLVITLELPSIQASRRARLETHRAWAENLLEVKDTATVIEVLQKETRLPRPEIEAFVDALRSGGARG
jgi:hypothetical protein